MVAPQAASTGESNSRPSTGPAGGSSRRKQLGAWYTPEGLVDHVVACAVDALCALGGARPAARVLDPACGDGRFLLAARQRIGSTVEVVGCDIDPGAVAAARAQLGETRAVIVEGDALTRDWGDERFDLVIGNPPFLNQMAASTTRGGRSRFGGGPYADAAAEFLALGMQLARPDGGVVAMIVPQPVLTTRDAAPIRAALLADAALTHVWWSPTAMFDAAVRTAALVFVRGVPQGVVTRSFGPSFEPLPPVALGRSWGALILRDDASAVPPIALTSDSASSTGTIGDIATITADFRQHYYGLVGAVSDGADGPPLITSGLIDPGVCHWGERPVRFAKQRFAAPRVALDRLSPPLQRWAATRLVPKVLVANQTRGIEAVIDRAGAWLPSVPVITCTPHRVADLDQLYAALTTPWATAWV
ncbi:MAG: class I SAM-dependent methyltransferase, partial [Actinomycetota bacterium]